MNAIVGATRIEFGTLKSSLAVWVGPCPVPQVRVRSLDANLGFAVLRSRFPSRPSRT